MSQTLTYNGYTHDPDACWFEIDRFGILGGTGRINKVRNIWKCHGRVDGTSISAVDAKVVAWEAAVRDGGDLIFSLGSTARLISSECAGGTHVKRLTWTPGYDGVRGSGAEGILRRTFALDVYGDILTTTDTEITEWKETLHAIGSGGPKIVPVTSLTGAVQAQQLTNYTPYFLLQSGSATGLTEYPTPPLPIYSGISGVFIVPDKQSISKVSARDWGINQDTQFTIRWSYLMWGAFGLTGTPNTF